MKTEKGRGMRLKKILHISTSSTSSSNKSTSPPNHQSVENNICNNVKINIPINEFKRRQSIMANEDFINKVHSINNTLPLLQIWPSQDSPEAHIGNQQSDDVNHFKYPAIVENLTEKPKLSRSRRSSRHSLDHLRVGDSGIDSLQTSPNPNIEISPIQSPSPIMSPMAQKSERKKSCSLLHPDHARILSYRQSICSDQGSMDEDFSEHQQINSLNGISYSSSSSQTSIVAANTALGGRRHFSQNLTISPHHSPHYNHQQQRLSDPWLQYDRSHRRRSSTMTMSGRLSLFDALDLEYALLRAAARGSINGFGPYSLRLGDSVSKLTFTQSLAFPELASKRRHSNPSINFSHQNGETENCLNIFAKVMTSCVLVMISFLVFLVVYKYVKT